MNFQQNHCAFCGTEYCVCLQPQLQQNAGPQNLIFTNNIFHAPHRKQKPARTARQPSPYHMHIMIAMALKTANAQQHSGKMTVEEVCNYIKDRHPDYSARTPKLAGNVRACLDRNHLFTRAKRGDDKNLFQYWLTAGHELIHDGHGHWTIRTENEVRQDEEERNGIDVHDDDALYEEDIENDFAVDDSDGPGSSYVNAASGVELARRMAVLRGDDVQEEEDDNSPNHERPSTERSSVNDPHELLEKIYGAIVAQDVQVLSLIAKRKADDQEEHLGTFQEDRMETLRECNVQIASIRQDLEIAVTLIDDERVQDLPLRIANLEELRVRALADDQPEAALREFQLETTDILNIVRTLQENCRRPIGHSHGPQMQLRRNICGLLDTIGFVQERVLNNVQPKDEPLEESTVQVPGTSQDCVLQAVPAQPAAVLPTLVVRPQEFEEIERVHQDEEDEHRFDVSDDASHQEVVEVPVRSLVHPVAPMLRESYPSVDQLEVTNADSGAFVSAKMPYEEMERILKESLDINARQEEAIKQGESLIERVGMTKCHEMLGKAENLKRQLPQDIVLTKKSFLQRHAIFRSSKVAGFCYYSEDVTSSFISLPSGSEDHNSVEIKRAVSILRKSGPVVLVLEAAKDMPLLSPEVFEMVDGIIALGVEGEQAKIYFELLIGSVCQRIKVQNDSGVYGGLIWSRRGLRNQPDEVAETDFWALFHKYFGDPDLAALIVTY